MPEHGAPANPSYGFFLRMGTTFNESLLPDIANKDGWRGVHLDCRWYEWETQHSGNFDVAQLRSYLDTVHSYGLKMTFRIAATKFNTTIDGTPIIPAWLYRDSSLPNCNITDKYGVYYSSAGDIHLMVWDEDSAEYLILAYEQAINGVKDHPAFEGVTIEETTQGYPQGGGPGTCGWDSEDLRTFWHNILSRCKAASPDHMVVSWPNWVEWDNGDRGPFCDWCVNNDIAIGCPDVSINPSDTINDLFSYMKTHRQIVATAPEIQWMDVEQPNHEDGGLCTPEELVRFAIDRCDPWYIFVTSRRPWFQDADGTLDSHYDASKHPVASFTEIIQTVSDEGVDLGEEESEDVAGVPTNPQFGFYLLTGQSINWDMVNTVANAGWEGVTTRNIRWSQIETAEGVYDFSTLDEDIEGIAQRGMVAIIRPMISWYGTTPPYKSNAAIPSYILSDSKYGYCNGYGGPYDGTGTGVDWYGCWMRDRNTDGVLDNTFVMTWNPEVKARMKAFYQALGERYNGDDRVEGISIGIETSIGKPTDWVDPQPPD